MAGQEGAAGHLAGRVVVVTGAGGGFGKLIAEGAAARGARVVLGDIEKQIAARPPANFPPRETTRLDTWQKGF